MTSYKNYCNCGGYAASMNGRDPANPHMTWCAQYEEWKEQQVKDEYELGKGWIRGAVLQPGEGKVILAEQDKVEEHARGVTLLLDILQHPEALVTDLSTLGDFRPDGVTMRILGNAFRRILNMNELIWELAKELEEIDDTAES